MMTVHAHVYVHKNLTVRKKSGLIYTSFNLFNISPS